MRQLEIYKKKIQNCRSTDIQKSDSKHKLFKNKPNIFKIS